MAGGKLVIPTIIAAIAGVAVQASADGPRSQPVSVGAHAARCSLEPIAMLRSAEVTFMVARAGTDTVYAGRGEVATSPYAGHYGGGDERSVYGQVVDVQQLGGVWPESVALPGESTRRDVVLVPWDYDSSCAPTYWTRSARWIQPGLVGFYHVVLRPRAHWAGDRPTFDAYEADINPYPHGEYFAPGPLSRRFPVVAEDVLAIRAMRERASLTASEMFSLYAALPTGGDARPSAEILAGLDRWEADHADIAMRWPAAEILENARRRFGGVPGVRGSQR